jgi:hypothetical protein
LTYAYIRHSYHFYRDARIKFKRLFSELSEQNVKSVVFYGATDLSEIAFLSLKETPIKLVGIFDADKAGTSFFDLKIERPERMSEFSYDRLLYTNEEHYDVSYIEIDKEKMVFIT